MTAVSELYIHLQYKQDLHSVLGADFGYHLQATAEADYVVKKRMEKKACAILFLPNIPTQQQKKKITGWCKCNLTISNSSRYKLWFPNCELWFLWGAMKGS